MLRRTNYYLMLETEAAGPKTWTLKDRNENTVARVSLRFKYLADIEGSAKLEDGRTVNVNGCQGTNPIKMSDLLAIGFSSKTYKPPSCETRWKVTANLFGDGAYCPLVPWKSAAVDPSVVPPRSVIFIPRTRGVKLADGSLHSGIWRADDVGGAIKKDRIDLFTGAGQRSGEPLKAAGIGNLYGLDAYVLPGNGCK